MSTDIESKEMEIESIDNKPPVTRIHECPDGKTRNDEQYKAYKSKKELFDKKPDEFIHVDDIVIAALKSEHGIGVMIGKCSRQDMELALVRVQYRGFSLFQQMEIQQMMKAESEKKIVTAPGAKPTGGIIT